MRSREFPLKTIFCENDTDRKWLGHRHCYVHLFGQILTDGLTKYQNELQDSNHACHRKGKTVYVLPGKINSQNWEVLSFWMDSLHISVDEYWCIWPFASITGLMELAKRLFLPNLKGQPSYWTDLENQKLWYIT